MSYSISVVVPNYNGQSLLEQNLPFVFLALKSSGINDWEIIVSDDASTDNSAEFIKSKYPEIIWLSNSVNTGFSGNCNRGIRAATKELILLLNTDVTLTENYFTEQLPCFEWPDTFGVMSLIKDKEGTIQDMAKFPAYTFANIKGTVNYTLDQAFIPSFFLSGANALIRRTYLLQLGGFNELFNPYYGEDLELGIRAWRSGYRMYTHTQSYCIHPSASTINKEKKDKVLRVQKRNKLLLHYLHLPKIEWMYFYGMMYLKSIARLLLGNTIYLQSLLDFNNVKKKILTTTKFNYSLKEVCTIINTLQ